ncbi:MAG: spondin domain-containing protein [Nitrospirae bacterium]|nr:spondin domain-containing protein [Nitrospirota bacterium]
MKRLTATLTAGLLIMMGFLTAVTASAEEGRRYSVTITNLSRGQVITPPVVISHSPDFELFTLGSPATPELAALAEDGSTAPLLGFLATLPTVLEFTTAAGPVLPGGSVTLELNTVGPFDAISAVGMLATTNDGFFGIRGIAVPKNGKKTVEAEAYDAGSEGNSESCAFIPGPPCGNAGVRDTASAEGFVHVHAGIHGIGDLVPATHDWRNPAAEITIQRIQ